MLVNTNEYQKMETPHVKFISYSGVYPNLCRGILTLEIDGKRVSFGHNYCNESWKNDGNYNRFWESGGGLDGNYNAYYGEWEISVKDLPEQYKKYAREIDIVFNDNVECGCCGGCA